MSIVISPQAGTPATVEPAVPPVVVRERAPGERRRVPDRRTGHDRRRARRERRRGRPDARTVPVERRNGLEDRRSGRPDRRLGGDRRRAGRRAAGPPPVDPDVLFWGINAVCWTAVTVFALVWPV
jgi:hypothetical protein